jgi:hypothetical protein
MKLIVQGKQMRISQGLHRFGRELNSAALTRRKKR